MCTSPERPWGDPQKTSANPGRQTFQKLFKHFSQVIKGTAGIQPQITKPLLSTNSMPGGKYATLSPTQCGSDFCYHLSHKSCLTLCDPHGLCSPPGSAVHGISQAKNYWSEFSFLSPGNLPDAEIKLKSPPSAAVSFLLSHQGNPWQQLAQCNY